MIPCLVVTHGQLANELVAAAEMIVGEFRHIMPLCLGWQDDVNEAREEIRKAIAQCDMARGLIILTDMFGGTPSNLAISFMQEARIEVVTGVNLPMIVKAASQGEDDTLAVLAERIGEKGKANICISSRILSDK